MKNKADKLKTMSLFERLKTESVFWTCELPASEAEIQNLISHFGNNLPTQYLDLLRFCNGGEGDLALQQVYFQLWSTKEAIEINNNLPISEFIPGFMAFGGDRANEIFAFRVDDLESRIYMIPLIGMSEEDAMVIAENFTEFIEAIGIEYQETKV